MRKLFPALALSLLAIAACNPESTTDNTDISTEPAAPSETQPSDRNIVEIPTSPATVQFPDNWYENPNEYPYELQYLSADGGQNTGIFVYNTNDLASNLDAIALLDFQIEDLESKRENFTVVEPRSTITLPDKTIHTAVFSGEKNLSTFNYKLASVEFTENSDYILVTLQVAFPSEWQNSKPILEEIIQSFAISAATETP